MGRLPAHGPRAHPYFALPDQWLDITEPELYVAPLRVRYKLAGTGPPLLLVHGLQTTSFSWRYVIDALARDFTVVVPDVVGCGLTSHPADFGYTAEHVGDFLAAFMRGAAEQLDLPPRAAWNVAGNSLGGLYVSALAARHPDLVRSLVVIHAPGFVRRASRLGVELLRRGLAPPAVAHLFGPWLVRRYLAYHDPSIRSEEEIAEFSLAFADLEGRRAFFRIIREGLGPAQAGQLPGLLSRIAAPTLLIWARNDTLIPPATGDRWHQALPGSRLVWLDESSHFTQVDQPERTVELIRSFAQEP